MFGRTPQTSHRNAADGGIRCAGTLVHHSGDIPLVFRAPERRARGAAPIGPNPGQPIGRGAGRPLASHRRSLAGPVIGGHGDGH